MQHSLVCASYRPPGSCPIVQSCTHVLRLSHASEEQSRDAFTLLHVFGEATFIHLSTFPKICTRLETRYMHDRYEVCQWAPQLSLQAGRVHDLCETVPEYCISQAVPLQQTKLFLFPLLNCPSIFDNQHSLHILILTTLLDQRCIDSS